MTNKTQAHIRYRNQAGDIVPGVTTVLNVLNKPALVIWANQLGLKGIDSTKYRDEMADIGTLAHYLILCELRGDTPDTSDYSKQQIDQAENAMLSYLEWAKGHTIEPIMVEEPLVSDTEGFGGTVDLFAKIDGVNTLVDFKTGKGLYPEFAYQVAAYQRLLSERFGALKPVQDVRLLRIGREADEGFEEKRFGDLSREWGIFKACLTIYQLQANIRRGK